MELTTKIKNEIFKGLLVWKITDGSVGKVPAMEKFDT